MSRIRQDNFPTKSVNDMLIAKDRRDEERFDKARCGLAELSALDCEVLVVTGRVIDNRGDLLCADGRRLPLWP